MDDLAVRVKTLEEKARKRTENDRDAQQDTRRAQWQAVKEKAPEIADFMQDIAKAFGKPKRVKVTMNSGEVILDSSEI